MHLNFMALIGQEDDKKSENASDLSDQEEDDGLNQELETEYKTLFDKFAELSHENLQLLKDKAMLKAQVNILELKQCSAQTPTPSILKESDQETLALKRAMTEQERVHKQFEGKVNQLSDLLAKEMDKSKLLENQLSENHKKIKMLTSGTEMLDHLLTLGQSPNSNWGLGFQGSTSKSAEQITFVKETAKRKGKMNQETTKETNENGPCRVAEKNKNLNRAVPRTRRNGCHFCGRRGHHVRFCYFHRQQYERAWRLNLCYVESSFYGHVWVAKRDLYPNYKELPQVVFPDKIAETHIESEQDFVFNFATIQGGNEAISNVAFTSAGSNNQVDIP